MAYVCRDFNITATSETLKALRVVTYISSPNFVNSFGHHIGEIKFLYKNKDDLVQFQEEMKQEDAFAYHFRSIATLLGNNLNEILDYLNDDSYSVVSLTDQSSSMQVKDQIKNEFSEMAIKLNQTKMAHPSILMTMLINVIRLIKDVPIKNFNVQHYRRFTICENNENERETYTLKKGNTFLFNISILYFVIKLVFILYLAFSSTEANKIKEMVIKAINTKSNLKYFFLS